MDELESLGSSLGGLAGGGGYSASSAATATSGGPITADTDFNFGSGTLVDSPTITATPTNLINLPPTSPISSTGSANPVTYATPLNPTTGNLGAIVSASNSVFGGSKLVLVGGLIFAIAAIYFITRK